MDVPSVPSTRELRIYADRSWRRILGFSAAFFLAVLPELITICLALIPGLEKTVVAYSLENLLNPFLSFLHEMMPQLVFALFIVYFLRVLYWFRVKIPRLWNRYTPPFESPKESQLPQLQPRQVPDENIDDSFYRAERNFLAWLALGAGFFLLTWGVGLLVRGGVEHFGVSSQLETYQSVDGLVDQAITFVTMLPMINDLTEFSNLIRGRGFFEIILLNGPIVFYTVALRNWAFQFEHFDYVLKEVTLGRPIKYPIYILFSILAILFTLLICVVLIAGELMGL